MLFKVGKRRGEVGLGDGGEAGRWRGGWEIAGMREYGKDAKTSGMRENSGDAVRRRGCGKIVGMREDVGDAGRWQTSN